MIAFKFYILLYVLYYYIIYYIFLLIAIWKNFFLNKKKILNKNILNFHNDYTI